MTNGLIVQKTGHHWTPLEKAAFALHHHGSGLLAYPGDASVEEMADTWGLCMELAENAVKAYLGKETL